MNEADTREMLRLTLEALVVATEELAKAHEELAWLRAKRLHLTSLPQAPAWIRDAEGAAHGGCCPEGCDLADHVDAEPERAA